VSVWNEDGLPQRFEFLQGAHCITRPPQTPQSFEVVLVLDTAVRERVGQTCLSAIAPGALWINMDHHVSNDRKGDLVYIDSAAPAAGEVLFELFEECKLPVTPEMAHALYAAISTDTGSFQYPNTTARTYEIAAKLLRHGVKLGEINQQLYETNSRRRLSLLRELLNGMHFSEDGKVASFALPLETTARLGTIPDDTEGLIDTLRGTEGVEVAAFFEELEGRLTRISLRSKNAQINVCAICAEFGGGGHTLAAGARIAGDLETVKSNVLQSIQKHVTAAHA
jgi:phosphoesterase RecJ-like protein